MSKDNKLQNQSTEKLKKISVTSAKKTVPKKNGGARPGAGMPKGKKTQKVLERMHVLAEYKQKVMKHAGELFNAQFANARGNVYIYEIIEEELPNGKIKKRHQLVTDPVQIEKVLNENQGSSGEVEGGYFMVTTEKPDNMAIKDMLDRTFGTATQSIEMSGKDGGPLEVQTTQIPFELLPKPKEVENE